MKQEIKQIFHYRNIKSNSCLLGEDSIVTNFGSHNERRMRPDLYGLPLPSEMQLETLSEANCCLLGSTMLNCWDSAVEAPSWSYQHVNFNKRCKRSQSAKSIRRILRSAKVEKGKTKGHCNTMRFARNDADARTSCFAENIIDQTEYQNGICCKTWEDVVETRILEENFIAHITTVIDHRHAGHSMYKVLFEEYSDQLEFSCYKLYDAESSKENPYREVPVYIDEIQSKTQLDLFNSATIEKLGKSYSIL